MSEISPKEYHDNADVSARRIARVYATALLDTAEKQGQTEAVLDELESLVCDVFEKEPMLEVLMSSAAIGRHSRHATLAKIFEGRASTVFANFMQVLNDHERLDLVRPILSAATEIYDLRHRRLRVFVTSAVPLDDDIRKRLETDVQTYFHWEPVLISQVDQEVLGGLKIRIGDRQFDGTVRFKLDNLRDQFLAKGSHEIQSGRDRFCTGE
jgi:F-type H+-transporting ATPase subunit delta